MQIHDISANFAYLSLNFNGFYAGNIRIKWYYMDVKRLF